MKRIDKIMKDLRTIPDATISIEPTTENIIKFGKLTPIPSIHLESFKKFLRDEQLKGKD